MPEMPAMLWEVLVLFSCKVYQEEQSQTKMVIYYQDAIHKIKHRDNGPAITVYRTDGSLLAEHWYINNQLHRQDGPASIFYFPGLKHIMQEEWRCKGVLHRCGAPAVTVYNKAGTVVWQEWYQLGKLHREGGPAFIERRPEQNCYKEMWFSRGKLHRENGPAVMVLINGETVNRSYYLEGVQKMTSNL